MTAQERSSTLKSPFPKHKPSLFLEFFTETLDNGNVYTIAVVSKEFYVVDEQRNVFSESPLADSKAVVTLELAEDGAPQSASLKVEKLD